MAIQDWFATSNKRTIQASQSNSSNAMLRISSQYRPDSQTQRGITYSALLSVWHTQQESEIKIRLT